MGEIERVSQSSQGLVVMYEWNQYYCHDWIHVYVHKALIKA